MSYLYSVTSQKATSVQFSVTCHFTSPTDRNLILGKGSHLEIYILDEQNGLALVEELPLFGRIKYLDVLHPYLSSTDSLFILTERKRFAVLSYDIENKKILTKSIGNAKDRIGRDAEMGQRGFIDPEGKMIGMMLNDGLIKAIPIDQSGLKDPFNLTLEESRVIDIKFLHGSVRPTLCLLYEDNRRSRHVKTLAIDLREKELVNGTWHQNNVEFNASMLIPVPSPLGGVLVVGVTSITYLSGTGVIQTVEISPTQICSYCAVEGTQGTRYLLGDYRGQLMVLSLHLDQSASVAGNSASSAAIVGNPNTKVISMTTDILGNISIPETMTYLGNGLVFVGSALGDSQLVKLLPVGSTSSATNTPGQPLGANAAASSGGNSSIEIIDVYPNVGPILDMCLVDNTQTGGQRQLVTCSGGYNNGSLRVIRNGIGIYEQAALEIEGIKGVWSLKAHASNEFDKYLVQSFTTETRILAIEGEELGEVEIQGFAAHLPTLYCANLTNNYLLQVTTNSARIVETDNLRLVSEYIPSNGRTITLARSASNSFEVILSLSGGEIHYLTFNSSTGRLDLVAQRELDQDIACLSFHMSSNKSSRNTGDDQDDAMEVDHTNPSKTGGVLEKCIAVGMWTDNTIRLLTLPDLEEINRVKLNTDAQARDILLTTFTEENVTGGNRASGDKSFLFVGMGDGYLITYNVELTSADNSAAAAAAPTSTVLPSLINRRKGALGRHPIKFTTFRYHQMELCIFAACDRPTVIYLRHGKLVFSIVNSSSSSQNASGDNGSNEVSEMTAFHSELFPDCLAFSSENSLSIGTVEDIQKVHIQSIPLGEAPRRIAYAATSGIYAVCTERTIQGDRGDESVARVLFFEENRFQLIGSFDLDYLETALSITTINFEGNSRPYIAVGTAQVINDELEPSKGRIIIFDINEEKKINVITDKETKAGVYSLVEIQGRLAAGVGSKIQIFKLVVKEDGLSLSAKAAASSSSAVVIQPELQNECTHQGHIMALYLKASHDYLVVGDIMRSITLLRYKVTESTIEEVARDFNSNFMRAIEIVPGYSSIFNSSSTSGLDDHYLGCDDHGNLFSLARKQATPTAASGNPANEEENMKLESRGEYHLGDYINVMRSGTLVIQPIDNSNPTGPGGAASSGSGAMEISSGGASDSTDLHNAYNIFDANYRSVTGLPASSFGINGSNSNSSILYGTISGSIGCLLTLSELSYRFFSAIEKAMKHHVVPIGGFPHDEYRAFQNEMRATNQNNFLDGDLIESFLDVTDKATLESILRQVNDDLLATLNNNSAGASSGSNTDGNNSGVSTGVMISNLANNGSLVLTLDDIYRRIEDIARLH